MSIRFWSITMLCACIFCGILRMMNSDYDAAGWAFNCGVWAGICAEMAEELA